MTASDIVQTDERIEGIRLSVEAIQGRILSLGLLLDVMFRAWRNNDPCWDLFGLLFFAGAASAIYQWRHRGLAPHAGRLLTAGMIVATLIAALVALSLTWLRRG
jgi:hypothetical protein